MNSLINRDDYVEDAVALVKLDSKNLTIIDMSLTSRKFKFKCKRCASLCCNLGGPVITKKDAESIESSGYCVSDFLEPLNQNEVYSSIVIGGLKSKKDGSCIFLKSNIKQNHNYCSIYSVRPVLCKLYPFTFEFYESNKIALKIIPCCVGLNSSEAKLITEKFISDSVLEPLLEAVALFKN